jgi:arylsulfatase
MMISKRCLVLLLMPALFLSACALDPGAKPARYNILLIVLDAVRADHLGCYGYNRPTSPNIDKLAAESILFEQAYSQGIQTLPSFGSFLTGKYPSTLNLYWTNPPHRILHPEELTLPEVLRIHNYRTAAFPTGPHLLPIFGLTQGFQIYTNNPDFDVALKEGTDFLHQQVMSRQNAFVHPEGKREVWSFQDILPLITNYLQLPHNQPFFMMAHSNDAHPPYDNPIEFGHKFDPGYQGVFCGKPRAGETAFRLTLSTLNNIQGHKLALKGLSHNWDYLRNEPYPRDTEEEILLSDRDLKHIRAHYDGAIAYADECVGRILKQLVDSGLDKNTMVILIADHGETLGERELFDRSFGTPLPLYNEVCHVPLIIRLPPALKSRIPHPISRIDTPVQLVDLMPTILDLIGIKAPDNLDGLSLKSIIATTDIHRLTQINKDRPIITEALPDELAFRLDNWKLMYRPAGLSEFYNLANDPVEQNNLIDNPEAGPAYNNVLSALKDWQKLVLARRGAWAVEFTDNLWMRVYQLDPVVPAPPEAPKAPEPKR